MVNNKVNRFDKLSYMRNQIVILAAGMGKRMGNASVPKVLVMLKDKPMILHLLGQVEKINQLAKSVIVVGHMREKVEAILGEGFLYAHQKEQKGTAHAVMAARPKVSAENILVLYGDMPFITAESLKKLMHLHHDKQSILTMFTVVSPDFEGAYEALNGYGRIIRDGKNQVIKITEFKDATEKERQIKEVNPGIYMFNTGWLWSNIEKVKNNNAQNEFYLTDMIELAISQNVPVATLNIDVKEVVGVNTKEQLTQAELLA